MYWRPGKPERFVRPVRWLVALLDGEIVPLEFGGITAGRTSRGHRILAPAPVALASPAEYAEKLRAAHVLPSYAEREHKIRKALDAAVRKLGGPHPPLGGPHPPLGGPHPPSVGECGGQTLPGARWREDSRAGAQSSPSSSDTDVPTPIAFERLSERIRDGQGLESDGDRFTGGKATHESGIHPLDSTHGPLGIEEVVGVSRAFLDALSTRYRLPPKTQFKALFRDWMSVYQILVVNQWSRAQFVRALWLVERAYARGVAHMGMNVGVLAAQSLAEPLVQLALDAFHSIGSRNKVVNNGLSRCREITEMMAHNEHPTMRLPLHPKHNTQADAARLAEMLPALALGQAAKLEILWANVISRICRFPEDVKLARRFEHGCMLDCSTSSLVMRWEADRLLFA